MHDEGESTKMATEKINGFDKWEISSALETLISAREIMKDDKKVAAIQKLIGDKAAATNEVKRQLDLTKKVSKKMKKVFK